MRLPSGVAVGSPTVRLASIMALTLALVLAAAGAVAVGASILQADLPPPFGPARNGLIAFESGGDIWVVDPDGTDRRQLTSAPGLEHSPAWSADGTRLAYWSQEALGTPPSVMTIER